MAFGWALIRRIAISGHFTLITCEYARPVGDDLDRIGAIGVGGASQAKVPAANPRALMRQQLFHKIARFHRIKVC